MPIVREPYEVLAIFCSDLHISLTPPVARENEPDWLEAQDRILTQLRVLALQHKCNVIIAGDIFDRWNAPAELINWLADRLPLQTLAIPGQHDLPLHNYEDIKKSAYYTLHKMEALFDLSMPHILSGDNICLWPFPWGRKVTPFHGKNTYINIAVAHSYIWKGHASYIGAKNEHHYDQYDLQGYDFAIFGDNHKPFEAQHRGCKIFNCGGFQCRKTDEALHRPSCGLLLADGTIKRHYFADPNIRISGALAEGKECERDYRAITSEMMDLTNDHGLDYADAVRRATESCDINPRVRELLLKSIKS